ncbi:MAG: type II toxin-antitoxin system death-on-curing family toxin [Gemmatimonadetes bacterium]|uniref:Type II toxin-antitoxin system death-on-curing family toxin n=1 Tax=Candidatus Kutchimonas denitrificans TaxID=3056748 RepID=A0AAE4ZAK8_9BACT|nr:type II toxin-antitoxin system death-on-curing family toxin [Gemmatimonadota bacterium]NIR74576.1 type II toxin-antitoxin system death-on-curing family toxin [Candidatus Kutchimonas denitrificans]NIS02766.1 type II toxin-antitoxin system death-on-curing family toxin [Gemmatimonadota bacterium]NIT68927.1 type II toxin-antitoxin system death-on-curing family toxin [Gemmatimonadota bacterium]NIU52232.1 type II toxin-antitoxin system death-on-curing family toxin [Gemmatimonadota bacterium]
MDEPAWLSRSILDIIHTDQIRQHGGSLGVRDEGSIQSALDRPRNRWAYDDGDIDLADLAAAYAYGLCTNHRFVDGNKRVAFMAAYTFLGLNDHDLDVPEPEVVLVMRDLASGNQLAGWIRKNLKAI